MKNFLKKEGTWFTLSLIAFAFLAVGFIVPFVSHDARAEVHAPVPKPGYETKPGYAIVYASTAKKAADVFTAGWIALSVVLIIAIPFAIFQLASKSYFNPFVTIGVIIALMIAGFFGTHIPSLRQDDSKYEKAVPLEVYEANKASIDSLF